MLIGLGAGYSVPWKGSGTTSTSAMTPGVGMATLPNSQPGLGVVPVEEGQINTSGMSPGAYVLKVIPDDGYGMNVLRGDVDLTIDQNSFATGAQNVDPEAITFFLEPPRPQLDTAVSRKTHASIDRDITVPASTECRSAELGSAGGALTILATFDIDVQLLTGTASDVTTDVGIVGIPTQKGLRTIEVPLSGVPHQTKVTLGFPGVADATNSSYTSSSTLCVPVMVGDYDGSRTTSFFDLLAVKNASLLDTTATAGSFRADFDTNGTIDFIDFFRVKARGLIGQSITACP